MELSLEIHLIIIVPILFIKVTRTIQVINMYNSYVSKRSRKHVIT